MQTPTVHIIIGPIIALLKSRKFMTALGAIITSLLVARAPELAPYADVLILGIVLIAAALTGSIAAEDAAKRKAEATEAAAKTQAENLQEAIEAALETFYSNQSALVTAETASVDLPIPTAQEVADQIITKLVERERIAPFNVSEG